MSVICVVVIVIADDDVISDDDFYDDYCDHDRSEKIASQSFKTRFVTFFSYFC